MNITLKLENGDIINNKMIKKGKELYYDYNGIRVVIKKQLFNRYKISLYILSEEYMTDIEVKKRISHNPLYTYRDEINSGIVTISFSDYNAVLLNLNSIMKEQIRPENRINLYDYI